MIVEVARFSGVFEVYYDVEPYSTKDRLGILSGCFEGMIGQASRWTRQARASVKSAPEPSILSIPDVEWFNCGYALLRHDRKLAAPTSGWFGGIAWW